MKKILTICIATMLSTQVDARSEPEPSPESTKAYREGYNLVLNGDWEAASNAFAALIRNHPNSSWVDDAAFWQCYSAGELNQDAETVFQCYDELTRNYPRSEWRDDAKRAMVRLASELDRSGKSRYRERVKDFGDDDDGRELLQVLVALAEIGDERSVDIVLDRLSSTQDEHLRARMVEVLEDVNSPKVEAQLMSLLNNDPSELVRVAAVEVLSDHDNINAMGLLRQIAEDTSQPTRVRVEALEEVSDHRPPDGVTFLRALALDDDERVALEAISELSDIETDAALQALVELQRSIPDAKRRARIINRIEDYESEAAANALLQIAKSDPDPRIRREATEALGDMEIAIAREALIELLQSMDAGE